MTYTLFKQASGSDDTRCPQEIDHERGEEEDGTEEMRRNGWFEEIRRHQFKQKSGKEKEKEKGKVKWER